MKNLSKMNFTVFEIFELNIEALFASEGKSSMSNTKTENNSPFQFFRNFKFSSH